MVGALPWLEMDTATGLLTLGSTAGFSGSGTGALKTRDDQGPRHPIDVKLAEGSALDDALRQPHLDRRPLTRCGRDDKRSVLGFHTKPHAE